MIDIRPLTLDLVNQADELLQSAFGKPERRVNDLLRVLRLQPDGYSLAYLGGELAGMGGAVDYGEFAYIGMMAVHPRFQRKGVARSLLEYLLSWIDARAIPAAFLDASSMGYPLYQAMGFVDVEDAAVYHRPEAVIAPPPPAGVRRMQPDDLPELADLDRPIFGADRSHLLALLLGEFPDSAWVARREDGGLAGYLFAKGRRIGPWVAADLQDAEGLLQAALYAAHPAPGEGIPSLVVPAGNRASHGLLLGYGFQRLWTCRHMRRGCPPPAERRDLVYAQTSYAIG
jgi:GNAT superfamily N-acetyltransferase